MKRLLALLSFSIMFSLSCSSGQAPIQDNQVQVTVPAAMTMEPAETSSPTPVGTWLSHIDGRVYTDDSVPGKPIVGAIVRYEVLHSHFPGLQDGRGNTAVTDEQGEFALSVLVHDTDSIRIRFEAKGFLPYEERLVGIDLLAGKRYEIMLAPQSETAATPR